MLAAGLVLASGVAAADAGYLQIKGSKQGEFKGDVQAKGKEGWNSVIGFNYTVPGASGRRVQTPVTFTLRWSKATPMLINAAITGEVLSEFRYSNWVPEATGMGTVVHADSLEFQGAKITSVQVHDRTGDSDAVEPVVDITISYQKAIVTHVQGAITVLDDWTAPK
ncbi:type VI secretion system effector, Hcp1 family protein [Asticcacaulis biprosthecium C19]|uniref:Type VI secretion system effector, Hcp1 family protein n=1 Tax=Asticcacaulis biprosthecium C19 TaxID=715226 RepID=F4QTN6_9CAUL|nr:type VI secretion system effector, Hcp1 family protein [Asticcacaulis biprosthecium C19]